jgi:isopentenyldiphosphate isomerase
MGYIRISADIHTKFKSESIKNKSIRKLAMELGISKSAAQESLSAAAD